MNKKLIFVLFCFFYVKNIMVISQDTEDVWENITSMEQIIGEWEGILYSYTDGIEIELPTTASYSKDDNKNYISDLFSDFNPLIDTMLNYIKTNKGITMTKDDLWDLCKFESKLLEENKETIFGKYFQRIKTIYPNEDKDRKFGYEQHYINQYRNKIKYNDIRDKTGQSGAILYRK